MGRRPLNTPTVAHMVISGNKFATRKKIKSDFSISLVIFLKVARQSKTCILFNESSSIKTIVYFKHDFTNKRLIIEV